MTFAAVVIVWITASRAVLTEVEQALIWLIIVQAVAVDYLAYRLSRTKE